MNNDELFRTVRGVTASWPGGNSDHQMMYHIVGYGRGDSKIADAFLELLIPAEVGCREV